MKILESCFFPKSFERRLWLLWVAGRAAKFEVKDAIFYLWKDKIYMTKGHLPLESYVANNTVERAEYVRIKCPSCGNVCRAVVILYKGDPFNTYIHNCEHCHYTIMESEWEELK